MPIIRIQKRENPYVQIDRAAIEDNRLSWRARGVLAYLLSKPDDWSIQLGDILNHGTEGRDAVQAAIKELQNLGYARLKTVRGVGGKVGGKEWEITEQPINGFSVGRYSPTTGITDVGKNRLSVNPLLSNNNKSSNNKQTVRSRKNENAEAKAHDAGCYPFAAFWDDYGHKVGSRAKCERLYDKLTEIDRGAIRDTLEMYKRETVTSDDGRAAGTFRAMRQHPHTYLAGRVWETYAERREEAQTAQPSEYDEAYGKYVAWVKGKFPTVAKQSAYLSKQQYITVTTTTYVKGMSYIGEASLRNLLIKAHEAVETGAPDAKKCGDVFTYNTYLVQDRVKTRNV